MSVDWLSGCMAISLGGQGTCRFMEYVRRVAPKCQAHASAGVRVRSGTDPSAQGARGQMAEPEPAEATGLCHVLVHTPQASAALSPQAFKT